MNNMFSVEQMGCSVLILGESGNRQGHRGTWAGLAIRYTPTTAERYFDFVVGVTPVQDPGVQVHLGGKGQGLEKVLGNLGFETTQPRVGQFGVKDQVGAPRQVDDHLG